MEPRSGWRWPVRLALLCLCLVLAAGTPAQQPEIAGTGSQPLKVLYSFTGRADGSNPNGSLVLNSAKLYGTTSSGGYLDNGTVFQIDLNTGRNTVLHTFTGGAADGANPADGLVQDSEGNFYGATRLGGTYNAGTIFRLDGNGMLSLLHSFSGADGQFPKGGLVRDSAGNLYGTASEGGIYNCGTVFKLDGSGNLTTLYNFSGLPEGAAPEGRLLLENGQLYGATESGGAAGAGIVFRVDPNSDAAAIVHSFEAPTGGLTGAGPASVGGFLDGAVARDSKGILYRNAGQQVREIDALGYLTALRDFTNGPRSFSMHGDLVLDPDGRLYGAAQSDGRGRNGGMIFEISTNAIRKPAALPTCQFTPSSETETLPWDFYGMQGVSETFYYNVPPGDTGFCWVPKASYTASWLSNVTPAQGYAVGSGENYITFDTAENTSTAPRAAQIRLGSGFVLTLKQSGYPTISCQYDPPSGTLQVGSAGGNSGTLYASAAVPPGHDGCIIYAPTSKATWISNLSPTTNQANGGAPLGFNFSFDVAANSGPARSAIVRLGKGFALTVKQDAGN
jgi:uncharacterized repeat protein (TIGR03803 family)